MALATRIAVAAAVAAMCPVAGTAQFSYRTHVDIAGFTVTVVDRSGEPVRGLTGEDFEVREDGTPQAVT